MKLRNIFLISSLAVLSCACQDDQETRPDSTLGKDVQFGGIISDNQTRTIYGDKANNAFPIYWLKGDQVIVTSPQCIEGRKTGTYQVPDGADYQNSAGEFNKIGETGVQWGTAEKADFYSIYPAEGVSVSGTTFSGLHVAGTQYNSLDNTKTSDTTEENPAVAMPEDMKQCFMYACTQGVDNGQVVNLGYCPLSTAIRIKVKGPHNNALEKVQIQSISLTAPAGVNLSGDFSVDLGGTTPVVTATNASNTVEVRTFDPNTQGYLALGQDEVAELNLFVIPQNGTQITNNWKITVTTPTQTFTKSLGGAAAGQGTLAMGKVHYLPTLPALDLENTGWDPANWMKNIPRNVYLSEISLPGSWNSLNKDFQNDLNIDAQYKAGVRAFHLDARYNATRTFNILSGYTYTLTDLAIANGGTAWDANNGNAATKGKVMNDAPTFTESLTKITDQVKVDEYMVVMATFAQNSATKQGETWEQAVSNICANNEKVIMATDIKPSTVVGDVLGRVIVIVNTENIPTMSGSKCFFANVPLKLTTSMFGDKVFGQNPMYYGSGQSGITLYSSQCQVEFQSHSDGYTYDSQGDDTHSRGYLPTPAQREQQINNVLNWSQTNYKTPEESTHNNWIYLGIGGYRGGYRSGGIFSQDVHAVGNSYSEISSYYNTWIDNKVKAMDDRTTNYYPVGIVLMNFVTDYKDVLKDILLLNNKFRKAYDSNWTPGTSGQSAVKSAAPGYSSGMKDHNQNAFGWN